MKKLLAILLVSAMLLLVAACGAENEDYYYDDYYDDGYYDDEGNYVRDDAVDAEDGDVPPPARNRPVREMSDTMEGTQTLEIYEMLTADVATLEDGYSMEADMMGFEMTIHRRGQDIYVNMNALDTIKGIIIVADGTTYILDEEEETYVSGATTSEQLDKIIQLFETFNRTSTQILGGTFVRTGTADFLREKDVSYEEIEIIDNEDNLSRVRYFFDDEGLIGLFFAETEHSMPLRITSSVPEGIFVVPDNYTEDENADFNERFSALLR